MSTVRDESVRAERDGALAIITIDHPPVNAVNRSVIAGIGEALAEAEQDMSCRAVILTGAGLKFFAAGADITEFSGVSASTIAAGQDLTVAMEASRLPIVAAVNGIAFGGGCELTLACDVRIASRAARFGQPEIRLGILPGWGGTQRLPRLVGRSAAMALLLTGDPIDAARALELGLVAQVVDADALLDAARAFAASLAAQAPLAVAAIKRAVHGGLDRPLAEGLAAERDEFVALFGTEDAAEGIAAFREKRAPNWSGR